MQHNDVCVWRIYYKYKRKVEYTTTTKPCTYAVALRAFNDEFNEVGIFKLVRIVPEITA